MFTPEMKVFFAFIFSLLLSIVLTYVVRRWARRYGYVAAPKANRWHKKPTAMMGGVAIFLTTVVVYALFVPKTTESLVILGGSSILFLVGLIDDILHIKPYQKLIGQFIGVATVIGFGLVQPWTPLEIFNIAITAFWLVGITNAINLLDNMDGLAAGIAAIAAFSLALGLAASGQTNELLLVSVFIGALVGFLVFNFNPASIFMGDCGSMFVGFLLASLVFLTDVGGRSRGVFSVLAVPALILFVPIFDTTFVTVLRKIWGRKASEGGRDHTSHRLVALGLSERSAVLMLYGFALLAGLIALLVREMQPVESLALISVFVLILTITGVYLSKVKVYKEQDEELALQNHAVFGFLLNLSHKRRVFEVVLDAALISLAYYAAYVLIFGSLENPETWSLFVKSLPILIVLKLFSFLLVGVYRGVWRYTSVRDLVTFTKAVALGSILSVLALLFFYRFQFFSRAVFVTDALILFFALSASRLAFRIFRQLLPMPFSVDGRNVLIYGAGDGGEMILRELKSNPDWNCKPVGFIDDDPFKKGKLIHGLRVFGGNGALQTICRENDVREILISCQKISPGRLKEIKEICQRAEISLKRAQLKIEPVDFE
ncbi:MAG: glycosyl transferase [Acidobacteria bacterium]|nr:glycosyl transferase [Acidobacteriota bacterium]MCA1638302.1 glycosyl transferase [Acidobacteriota bacterium]